MKFGLFSNGAGQRVFSTVARSWDEDLHEVVLADRLGYDEAWISEHTGADFIPHALPVPEMLICKAAALTENIKLGTGVRRIALYPPVQVAMDATVCDQLTNGRYLFGYGAGSPASGFEHRGIEFAKTQEMMAEGIDLILRCWTESEPFDFQGTFYHGKKISIYPKPYRAPHMPVAVATTRDASLAGAARRGFRVLTSQFARPQTIKRIADSFNSAGIAFDGRPRRQQVTAVRGIFVADNDERAVSELAPSWREHLAYTKKYFGFSLAEYVPEGSSLDDLTFESLMDAGLIIAGSPATVTQRLQELFNESGGFGHLLVLGGKDWGTRDQRDHSFELISTKIAPVFAHLNPDAPN